VVREQTVPVITRARPCAPQVIKGFCNKADGKDKLTALIQVRDSRRCGLALALHGTQSARGLTP
jgi:hypothetical protein